MPRPKTLVFLICALVFRTSYLLAGQETPQKKLASTTPDYSKESFLVESSETRIRFTEDGASVRTQTESIKILSEAAIQNWGVLQFPFASENEHVDVHYVRVLKADGATVPTPAANAMDLPSDVTRAAPMYSDLKQKQIPVKALGVGDTLQFEVAYVEDKPLVPGQFWYQYNFSRNFVILKELLEIRVPRTKLPKIANADLKPVVTSEGAEQIYTWTTSHTEATKPDGPDAQDTEEDGIDPEDKKPSVQLTTFASWQQVGDWYAKLAQSQAKVTPEIQAKADALVKGIPATDANARTQAIYDYVSAHIHYISLSFGVGRYQPHTATDVLENEYGDCKDKHTLLAALLKAEGIEAWPVLIGSTHKLDESIPSPAQFDHLITILPQGKNYIWLDSTPGVDPFAMLLFPLRDKQALVVPPAAPSFLLKTPADPPFPAEDRFTMRGALDDEGTYTAHGDLIMRGDGEVIYRAIFHATARAKWQDVLQAISYRLGFGGEVSNIQIDDPDQTQKPFHLAWDYKRKKYGNWDQRQITPPTGPAPIPILSEDKKPKLPIKLGAPSTTIYIGEIDLAPGATVDSHPNADVKTPFAEYHATYSTEKGKFLTERKITILKKEVPVSDWKDYIAFQKEITNDYDRMTTVYSPGATNGASFADSRMPGESEVDGLLRSAGSHIYRNEWKDAQPILEQAYKLDPQNMRVLMMYGESCLQNGKNAEGLAVLKIAAGSTSDPTHLASIAIALANSSSVPGSPELTFAETLANSSLTLSENQTASLTLDSIPAADFRKIPALAHAWTAVSVVASQLGDLDKAERYALAAWQLSQVPVAGDRLARIYEKHGKLALALETYKLAKGKAFPQLPGIDDRIAALEKRIGQSGPAIVQVPASLQDLRIVHFPSGKKVNAAGDFLILFEKGKVTAVKQLGGDPKISAYIPQLKEAKFDQTFPDLGPERIVRQGILSCSIYDPKCMFMMMTPEDATGTSGRVVTIHEKGTVTGSQPQ